MIVDEIRKILRSIIQGDGPEGQPDSCTSIRNLLGESFETGPSIERDFESKRIIKERQDQFLRGYAEKNGLLFSQIPPGCEYIARGGEAIVYLAPDNRNVVKVNDGRYYATWAEYFNSIIIHNLLFTNTTYRFIGFLEREGALHVVVQQAFVEGGHADLNNIRSFLTFNGFENIKRQD